MERMKHQMKNLWLSVVKWYHSENIATTNFEMERQRGAREQSERIRKKGEVKTKGKRIRNSKQNNENVMNVDSCKQT